MSGIEGHGFERFEKRMEALGSINQWGRPIMQKAVLYVHSQVPGYPPPPATSTYRRTGTLGRSITTSVKSLSGNEVAGYIGTKVVYAPYVIDQKRQAAVHRGRWWTLQGVVTASAQGVKRIFEREIRKLLT